MWRGRGERRRVEGGEEGMRRRCIEVAFNSGIGSKWCVRKEARDKG